MHLTRPSAWSLLSALFAAAACFACSIGLLFALPSTSPLDRFVVPGALGVGVLGALVGLHALVRFYTTEIGVTSRRVILKTGVVSRRAPEMLLEKIESQELVQSVIGRALGFGNVEVRGAGGERLALRAVDDPVRLKGIISAAGRTGASRPGSPSARPDPVPTA